MSKEMIYQTKCFDYHGHKYKIFLGHDKKLQSKQTLSPLYFLDANRQFDAMVKSGNALADDSAVLYVGIGYQDGVDVLRARTRDYTITDGSDEFKTGGGAEQFYQFIQTVLKPWIESQFNVNCDKQTLAGHSFGGHFVLYVAFNHHAAFQRYVAASPSIWWGNGAVIPEGEVKLAESIDWLSLLIGEFEEKVHPESSSRERGTVERINADPKLRVRDLAIRLLTSRARCSFEFLPGRRHPAVIRDYAKVANIVASQKPLAAGL